MKKIALVMLLSLCPFLLNGCSNAVTPTAEPGPTAETAATPEPLDEDSLQYILQNQDPVSFRLAGQAFDFSACTKTVREQDGVQTVTYLSPDGLQIDVGLRFFDTQSAYWTVRLTNTAQTDSPVISALNSCSVEIPFEGDCRIWSTNGSWCNGMDLSKDYLIIEKPFSAKQTLRFSNAGGRSSQGTMPYFDIGNGTAGVLLAIGWSGQWEATIGRDEDSVNLKTGISGTNFRLHPNETVQVASTMLVHYTDGQDQAHNRFRRIIKEEFSPMGKGSRPADAPVIVTHMGCDTTEMLLQDLEAYLRNDVGAEVFWVDAGWFGNAEDPSNTGAWITQCGDWSPNLQLHPNGMDDLAAALHENGIGFLLWYEITRAVASKPIAVEHPEYFLSDTPRNIQPDSALLLNFASEEAKNWALEILSSDIQRWDLAWYRCDFNTSPLSYWNANDEADRKGITQIYWVNGMYQFYSELLARFPSLMIDNCASGGSLLDIEMMKYSVPLWRSDYQCNSSSDPEITQIQMQGTAWWMPYSCAGCGKMVGDQYNVRSAYSTGIVEAFETCKYYKGEKLDQNLARLAGYNKEYKAIRQYYSGDFYMPIPQEMPGDNWCAWQFELPEENSGILQVFRRSTSKTNQAELALGGVKDGTVYEFTDADTGESFTVSAAELKNGLSVEIEKKHSSKLFTYRIKHA